MSIDTTGETTFAELLGQLAGGDRIPALSITTPKEGENIPVRVIVDGIVRSIVADLLETTRTDASRTDAEKVRLACDVVSQMLVRYVSTSREDMLTR